MEPACGIFGRTVEIGAAGLDVFKLCLLYETVLHAGVLKCTVLQNGPSEIAVRQDGPVQPTVGKHCFLKNSFFRCDVLTVAADESTALE